MRSGLNFQLQWYPHVLVACVLSIIAVIPTAAQPAGSLSGVVRDGSGASIPDATVVVEASVSAFAKVVESGRDGAFELSSLPAAEYRVTVVAAGFQAQTTTVQVPRNEPITVVLQPAPVVEQVRVVSAAREEELRQTLNTSVAVISRARIEAAAAETVGEVLREVPGVLTRRGSETAGQAGEQIQGIDSRQVLVLIDGQPVPSARGIKRGIVNLDRQSTARLDRIEVVKGAASALYGSDAIGGVINLITRDAGAPVDLDMSVSGGSNGDFNADGQAGLRRGGWSALVIGERHQNDGFDLTPTTFDTTGAPFRRVDLFARASGRVHPSVTLSVLGTGYDNHTTGRSNGELGPQEDDITDTTGSLNIAADWALRPTTTVQTRAYASRFDEQSTGRLAPPSGAAIESGSLEEDINKFDASVSTLLAFDQVSASTTVGWAQHRMTFGNRLTTTVGARVDHHSAFGTAVSPKIAANVRINDHLHARGSYGGGFRAPDLGQLYYRFLNPSSIYQVIGNPNLDSEYARSVQIGADWLSSSRRARFGVNVFHNDVDNLIESMSLGMVVTPDQLAALLAREGLDPSFRPVLGRLLFTYKNVNDAITRGAELDGELAVTRQVGIGGAYTYLQARDAQTNLELTGRHDHQGQVRLSWHSDRIGLRANLRATAYSSWIVARAGTVETVAPGFVLWDVYAAQRLLTHLTAFGAIDNVTDNQDPNTGLFTPTGAPAPIYRPEVGRTIRVGVRWAWSK
jgi:outer membrane receptor for ferrienterochelin and colicins